MNAPINVLIICFVAICLLDSSTHFLHSQTLPTQQTQVPKYQISLDIGGWLTYGLSYARRLENRNLSIGGGLGYAWELNEHNFTRNIWEATYIVLFGRYQLSQSLHVDFGPTLMKYYWADDCSECTGTFFGIHSAAAMGYQYLFFGPTVRLGWADDSRYDPELGIIFNLQVRLIIPWGQ